MGSPNSGMGCPKSENGLRRKWVVEDFCNENIIKTQQKFNHCCYFNICIPFIVDV